jgi:hypothetical protein
MSIVLLGMIRREEGSLLFQERISTSKLGGELRDLSVGLRLPLSDHLPSM